MKRFPIDLKSALCGALVTLLVISVVGATQASGDGEVGRYQVCGAGSGGSQSLFIMVDTKTGKAWSTTGSGLHNTGSFYNDKR